MTRFNTLAVLTITAAAVLGLGPLDAAPEPGGRFYERLRQAEEKLHPGKPVEPGAVRPGTGGVRRVFREAVTKRYANLKPAKVTYSIDPRSEDGTAPKNTGDVILLAEPEDVKVFFNLMGGAQLLDLTTATVKQIAPKKLHVVAWAPELNGKSDVFIPVQKNSITTVRLIFHDSRPKKPVVDDPVKPEGENATKPGEEPAKGPGKETGKEGGKETSKETSKESGKESTPQTKK